jgi:tetratricopeptide (TPR) repeat protein
MIERPEAIAKVAPALEALQQGRGGLLYLSGGPGLGKTTLLEAIRQESKEGPAWARSQACADRRSSLYGSLIDLMRSGTGGASLLKYLGPSPVRRMPTAEFPHEDWKGSTPRALRVEVTKALEQAVLEFCGKRPAVLALDDAHEADPLTLAFFESILPRLSETPLLLALAGESGSSAALAHLVDKARESLKDRFWAMDLTGLSTEESSRLLTERLQGLALEDGIKNLVLEQAGGNPLYLTEIALFLKRTTSELFETHPSEIQLLDNLPAVILARVGTLETAPKSMLRAAAVLGPRFRRELLEAVATETGNFKASLAVLLERKFLRASPDGDSELRFCHPLICAEVYRALPPDQKARFHGLAAKAIERLESDKAPLLYELLAYHHEKGLELPVARHYLKLAGDKAAGLGAFVDAMHFYDKGVELSEKDEEPGQDRLVFLGRRGDLWEMSGNYQRALEDWVRVRDIAVESGNRVEEARADLRVGLVQRRLGHLEESIQSHEKAQELFREQKLREGQAWNLCDLGMTHHVQGEYKKALRHFRDAYKAFQEIDHRDGMAWCLYHVGMAYREMRQFAQALKSLEDAQRIFHEMGHRTGMASSAHDISLCYREIDMPVVALDFARVATKAFEELELAPQLAWSYDNLSVIYRNLTNREQALIYAEKARTIFERIGLADGLAWNLAGLGTTHLEMGHTREAEKCFGSAHGLFKKLRNEQGINWCDFSLGLAARYQFEFDKVQIHLSKALAGFQKGDLRDRAGWCLLNLAAVHRLKAEYAQAIRINQKALRLFSPLKMKDGVAWSLFQMGNVCKDQGKFLRSWQLHREALKFHHDVLNKQGIAWGHNELGLAYYELDDTARAAESFKSALDVAREIEETPVIAEATLGFGTLDMDRGDLSGAEERFLHARKLGADVGACRELARTALLKGDLSKAQAFLNEAQELVDRRGLAYLRSPLFNLAGELACAQGDVEKAKSAWQRSIQLARRLGQKKFAIEAMLALAQLGVQSGGDPKEILKVVTKVHKLLRSLGSRRLKVKALIVQGMVHGTADPRAAEAVLKQALRLLETLNLPILETRLLEDMISFYQGTGQANEAQSYQARLADVSKRWPAGSPTDLDPVSQKPRLPKSLLVS